jgi:methionyl-tRNA synthetase
VIVWDHLTWPRCELQDEGDLDGHKNCPIHRRPCQQRSEQNYFFRLSRYQQQIEVALTLPACTRFPVQGIKVPC